MKYSESENRKIAKKCLSALLASACLLLTACSAGTSAPAGAEAEAALFAMDTYITLHCYGERAQEAAAAAQDEIRRLDALLSAQNPDSEVARINRDKEGSLSTETEQIILEALSVSEQTDGAFDLTVFPLTRLWGFSHNSSEDSGVRTVPSEEEIAALLPAVDYRELSLADHTLFLGPDQEIDLGGIAKGYTSDRLMEIFQEYELTGAIVSLGGNVQCYGAKPGGSSWNVGIRAPFSDNGDQELLGVLETGSGAVITSGSYERFFTDPETGRLWHHILNPSTGYPAENGLVSVTIICDSGLRADALSTACFVMGEDRSAAFWRSHRSDFDMILVRQNGEIVMTAPLKDRFAPADAEPVITVLQ